MQASRLFLGNKIKDRLVFGGLQLFSGKFATLESGTGGAQVFGAKEAANNIVSIRRMQSARVGDLLFQWFSVTPMLLNHSAIEKYKLL